MRTRIPKLIAEINTIIADHSETDSEEEEEAIELLKRARHKLGLARVKLQEAGSWSVNLRMLRISPRLDEVRF
jgi:hypothetical protein